MEQESRTLPHVAFAVQMALACLRQGVITKEHSIDAMYESFTSSWDDLEDGFDGMTTEVQILVRGMGALHPMRALCTLQLDPATRSWNSGRCIIQTTGGTQGEWIFNGKVVADRMVITPCHEPQPA